MTRKTFKDTIMARSLRFSAVALSSLTIAGLGLAACTPPSHIDSDKKVDTAVDGQVAVKSTEGMEDKEAAEMTTSVEKAAPREENVTVALSATELTEGELVDVEITGLAAEAGYYTAICKTPTPDGAAPLCTGTLTDPNTAAWLKGDDSGTVKISDDGTATFTLTATAVGEGVDCSTDACLLQVFGDHTEGFRPVAAIPVAFKA
ncbi:thiamine biosynthesis protein [Corynebacterium sp. ES2794-CONJ1]|uniref:thiamine biosynthesis protein n=2 Tax=Corynebacterium TaxID=1716 RepID=UPI0021678BC5|nr:MULTISPECIES: thiamine biosynthesis protein [unclassified Corynebacterium]MCU9519825.1 thiamine biosynthesis protein [Corynebacterium sp. ES2794-CONJ1]